MSEEAATLKACPFCGYSEAWFGGWTKENYIYCNVCHCETAHFTDREDAIKAWNLRGGT